MTTASRVQSFTEGHFAFYVRGDTITNGSGIFGKVSPPTDFGGEGRQADFHRVVRAVGRVEYGPDLCYVSTGFVLEHGGRKFIVTSPSAAQRLECEKPGDAPNPPVVLNFHREYDIPEPACDPDGTIPVGKLLYRTKGDFGFCLFDFDEGRLGMKGRTPLRLGDKRPTDKSIRICVIGYPGEVPQAQRESEPGLMTLLDDRLGVKRISFGRATHTYGSHDVRQGWNHNATTSNGSGGSPIVAEDFSVVGVHHGAGYGSGPGKIRCGAGVDIVIPPELLR